MADEDQSSSDEVGPTDDDHALEVEVVVGRAEDVELSTRKLLLGKTGLFMYSRTWQSARNTYCRSWTLFIRPCVQRDGRLRFAPYFKFDDVTLRLQRAGRMTIALPRSHLKQRRQTTTTTSHAKKKK